MKITFAPRNRTLAAELETARFVLKPLGVLGTLRLTRDWRHDAELMASVGYVKAPRSLPMWIHKGPMPNSVDRFGFAIVVKQTGRPVGMHAVRLRGGRAASGMIMLAERDWWGRDAAVEVRARLMNHFFRHGPVDRFLGYVRERNIRSIFIYRRLGYAFTGMMQRPVRDPASGRMADLMRFEMPRATWEQGPFAEMDQ